MLKVRRCTGRLSTNALDADFTIIIRPICIKLLCYRRGLRVAGHYMLWGITCSGYHFPALLHQQFHRYIINVCWLGFPLMDVRSGFF